jgi:hypothetical protein
MVIVPCQRGFRLAGITEPVIVGDADGVPVVTVGTGVGLPEPE